MSVASTPVPALVLLGLLAITVSYWVVSPGGLQVLRVKVQMIPAPVKGECNGECPIAMIDTGVYQKSQYNT
jgi:hypothetical protein